MRKLARLSFSETGMLNITEADVELDEAIDVAEKNCNMQLDVFGWRRWLCYHVEINGTAYP